MPSVLIPHPATPCALVDRIEVIVHRTGPHGFAARYSVMGRVEELSVPAERPSNRTDGLWRHTCFEMFIGSSAAPSYFELNFSPSSCWAAYRFAEYRQGRMELEMASAPMIVSRSSHGTLEIDVRFEVAEPIATAQTTVRIGLAAVIEDRRGSLSYWALAHPSALPDFHHAGGFRLEEGNWSTGCW